MPDRLIRIGLAAAALTCLAGQAQADEPAEAADGGDEAALADELQELEEQDSQLHIYGFADFTYTHFLMDRSSGWFDAYFSRYPTFAVGNVNLYLEKKIAPRWHSLLEFRLLYLPNGTETVSSTGEVAQIDTAVLDYQDKAEVLHWGGVSIERAWVEYQAHPLLTIRAGQWLTPYGIWNADHGSPVLIGIRRPFVIGLSLFPKSQTGLELYGSRSFGDKSLTYHLTVSNGRGPVDSYLDLDYNKAVGGRLVFEAPWFDEFKVGASAYTGTFTRRARSYNLALTAVETTNDVTEGYRELAVAADLHLRSGPLIVNAEAISNQKVYRDDARPRDTQTPTGQLPDSHSYGAYVIAAYRLPWLGLMPYVHGEGLRTQWPTVPNIWVAGAGINVRASPTVTLKVQLQRAWVPGTVSLVVPDEPVTMADAQVAWVF